MARDIFVDSIEMLGITFSSKETRGKDVVLGLVFEHVHLPIEEVAKLIVVDVEDVNTFFGWWRERHWSERYSICKLFETWRDGRESFSEHRDTLLKEILHGRRASRSDQETDPPVGASGGAHGRRRGREAV